MAFPQPVRSSAAVARHRIALGTVLVLALVGAAPGIGTATAEGSDELAADLPTTGFLPQPWAASGDDLIAVNRIGSDDTVPWVTTDAGATWSRVELPHFADATLDWPARAAWSTTSTSA